MDPTMMPPMMPVIRPAAGGAPEAMAMTVREGRNGIERLELRVKVDTGQDERAELVKRARAETVDQKILSAEQVEATLANLGQLRGRGLYEDALAYHDLGALRVTAAWAWMPAQQRESIAM